MRDILTDLHWFHLLWTHHDDRCAVIVDIRADRFALRRCDCGLIDQRDALYGRIEDAIGAKAP